MPPSCHPLTWSCLNFLRIPQNWRTTTKEIYFSHTGNERRNNHSWWTSSMLLQTQLLATQSDRKQQSLAGLLKGIVKSPVTAVNRIQFLIVRSTRRKRDVLKAFYVIKTFVQTQYNCCKIHKIWFHLNKPESFLATGFCINSTFNLSSNTTIYITDHSLPIKDDQSKDHCSQSLLWAFPRLLESNLWKTGYGK